MSEKVKQELLFSEEEKNGRHEPIIILQNVSKEYPNGTKALKEINLKIHKGEFVFIVGTSGSGKSTLIKLLLKEVDASKGGIYVNGFYLHRLKEKMIPKLRRTMGIVFQDFRLLRDRNVYENIAFAQEMIGTPHRQISGRVNDVLSMVSLVDKKQSNPDELSGGEQQRIAIARALANKPVLLLADEPTGNLDPANTREIMSLLEDINKLGTTVVVVTHNQEIVNSMKKRVVTIDKGIIVRDEMRGGYSHA